ncbi:double-strand-break repair protein rad21 homolog isoform X2 [Xyrauchen texanus]|uniref:double-strand-break repair protein rad21 homolog isoform X2 n=1 Tax=Xyrauchen texanus TaxID=154827 RepID=UPI0022426B38|nr:double-strand-break repair protein rad21 homolog isoform X2 [Xyrauchen texanus]
MFYAQLFTSKRGTLAKIWLAAHWEKKITKAHVFECDLETTVKEILSPQIKIGLRTSGHLLLGVVRMYYRKIRYLLADCSDALVKIKVAFRPGETDLPEDALEATFKAITLQEDFTDFDSQLPDLNTIDVVDHFSLNQCRTEDITLRENLGNSFLTLDGIDFIANESKDTLVTDFYENTPKELPATPPTSISVIEPESVIPELSCSDTQMNSPSFTDKTFLVNAEEGFTLAPVAVTPTLTRNRGKRKRKLVVDLSKELTNDDIRDQLAEYSDLLTSLEIAPPTRQLMEWRENGGVKQLISRFELQPIHSVLKQLFPRDLSPKRKGLVGGAIEQTDPEEMREQSREDRESTAQPVLGDWSLLHESVALDKAVDANTSVEPSFTHTEPPPPWNATSEESRLELSYPEPLSEDSMLVHPSVGTRETPVSVLNSQDMEDRRMTCRAHKLLQALKSQDSSPRATFSLQAMCEGNTRSYVAALFFCLLVLRKQQALNLHQSTPYSDIIATPGPLFHSF